MKTRREFIKVSTVGAGVAALGLHALDLKGMSLFDKESADPASDEDLTPYSTYCEVCFWKCAGWTYVDKKGKIRKIIGNKKDTHSQGRLCPRGTGGLGMYEDEDRLKTPLIREENANGKQYFREASWDEALDLVAKKMDALRKEHGPECLALFSHGTGGGLFSHLVKAFGSENISAPSFAQCRGPREVGFTATFGEGVSSPERTDIRDAKCLVLIGSHLGENMHNGQIQEMSAAIENGATIITVDPRFSTAASHSKYWLPIKPATDMALLLAWINVIIEEDLYDKDYVKKYTYGFDELKAHAKNKTPEWAYGITTIEPDIIRRTAREMAAASPSVIVHPGRHTTWYGDDTQRTRAIAILNALLGSWGRRGGFYNPEKVHIPSFPHPPYPKPTRTWRDAYPEGKYKLVTEVLSTGICDATIPNPDLACHIRGWIVYGTNLMASLPDQKKTLDAIHNLDFLVVVDTMPMDITGYADVILPETTYLERYDPLRSSPHREPSIALRMPAVDPKNDTKPGWWITKQLAERLNLGDYFKWETMEDLLEWQLKQIGSSLEEMKKIGVKSFPREYDDLYQLQNLPDYEFNTNTGKIELYSTELAAEGFDPMPNYTAHPEPPEGYYRLNYGRAPMHTFSRTANNPNLTDLMSENNVWVNPKVAALWEIKNGQEVWLKNQDGVISSFPITVRVTERIRWDSVYMVHGFGQTNKKLTRAYGHGASDSELVTKVTLDPIMGGTGMRGNFVTFLKEKPITTKMEDKA
ncbi:MAG: molybdopterin-dependent oxidoreductase [Bacteroidales bacterium]|nr:molybdopterin-dependent oxidoreductase [Bacteroidales bacterium]